jgi:hypothetical protein
MAQRANSSRALASMKRATRRPSHSPAAASCERNVRRKAVRVASLRHAALDHAFTGRLRGGHAHGVEHEIGPKPRTEDGLLQSHGEIGFGGRQTLRRDHSADKRSRPARRERPSNGSRTLTGSTRPLHILALTYGRSSIARMRLASCAATYGLSSTSQASSNSRRSSV